MVNDSITKIDKILDRVKTSEEKIAIFSDILDSLSSKEEKKKLLWKEIYENALNDRENANMLFSNAWNNMTGGTQDHIVIGSVMAKYLEGMRKANDQILKLAELIEKSEERDAKIDPNEIFDQIGD